MANKKPKRIEVLSPIIKFVRDDENNDLTFTDILKSITGKKYSDDLKDVVLKFLGQENSSLITGIVETRQLKDTPPKINKRTNKISSLGLNIEEEALVFANVFLYDTDRNVLLYEVNANGCYLDKLIPVIYSLWKRENDLEFNLEFSAIIRKHEYKKLLTAKYIKEFQIELREAKEILRLISEEKDSIYNGVKKIVETAVKNNSDTISILQKAQSKKCNPLGIALDSVIAVVKGGRKILESDLRDNVKVMKVKGYFENPEEITTPQPLNLIADTFQERIRLPEVGQQEDLQEFERKQEILRLYERILPEIKAIIGEN